MTATVCTVALAGVYCRQERRLGCGGLAVILEDLDTTEKKQWTVMPEEIFGEQRLLECDIG